MLSLTHIYWQLSFIKISWWLNRTALCTGNYSCKRHWIQLL